jgi:hypothetical protein
MEGTSSGTHAAVSTRELAAQITELCGHLNAANRRWLGLIAEFDRRKGWSDSLTQSCAHWLNWQCGIALGAAREKVRVAHALEKLPLIGAAMSRGELSYSKVRALTRVACAATEQVFLSIALHGTAHHVETIVRQYRRASEAAELSREAQQQAGRRVSWLWDDDGSLVVKARLPAESGLLLVRALEAAAASGNRSWCTWTRPRFARQRPGAAPWTTARRSRSRRRGASRWNHATGAAASPAAPTRGSSTAITCGTGPTVAKQNCRTSSRCAASITARFTKAVSVSSASTTAPGAS